MPESIDVLTLLFLFPKLWTLRNAAAGELCPFPELCDLLLSFLMDDRPAGAKTFHFSLHGFCAMNE